MFKQALIASALCAVMAGCGSSGQQSTDGMPAPYEAITVKVENNNWQDIDVYAVNGGQRVRLGSVSTARTGAFVLPSSIALSPDLRIRVHPLAAQRDYVSPRISPSPGDVVEVSVPNSLVQTSVTVR